MSDPSVELSKWLVFAWAFIALLLIFSLFDSVRMNHLDKRITALESHRALSSPNPQGIGEPKP